ncbi:MAG: antitoxin, partial [Thermoanaerobaculia bacterium]
MWENFEMEERAKLFGIDGDQAVLLPPDCEFEGQEEVVIRREGDRVILEPVEPPRPPGFKNPAARPHTTPKNNT